MKSETPPLLKPHPTASPQSPGTCTSKYDAPLPINGNLTPVGSRDENNTRNTVRSEDGKTTRDRSKSPRENTGRANTSSNNIIKSPQDLMTEPALMSGDASGAANVGKLSNDNSPTKGQHSTPTKRKREETERNDSSREGSSSGRRKRSRSRSRRSLSRESDHSKRHKRRRRRVSRARSRSRKRSLSKHRSRSRDRRSCSNHQRSRSRRSHSRRSHYRRSHSRDARSHFRGRRSHSRSRKTTPRKYRVRDSRSRSRDSNHSSSRRRDRRKRSRSRRRERSRNRGYYNNQSRSPYRSSYSRGRSPRRGSRGRDRHRRHLYSSSSSRSTSSSRHSFPESKNPQSRVQVEQSVKTIAKEFSTFMQGNQKTTTISKLTNLCRSIQKDKGDSITSQNGADVGTDGGGVLFRAPFALKPTTNQPRLVLHNNVWKTTNQVSHSIKVGVVCQANNNLFISHSSFSTKIDKYLQPKICTI